MSNDYKIKKLHRAFREATPKWLAVHFVGFALIALILGWGHPAKVIFFIFIGVTIFLEIASLILYVIPNLMRHYCLLDEHGDDYLDLALEAVEEIGVIDMFDRHWFIEAERELREHAAAKQS